jgi:hypothetical protein
MNARTKINRPIASVPIDPPIANVGSHFSFFLADIRKTTHHAFDVVH